LIGVGLVGRVVAEHFLSHGDAVIGYDIEPAACDHLRQLGGHAAGSVREVAEAVDHLFLSLPDSNVVRQALESADGVLHARQVPHYVIDTTTGDPLATIALAENLRRHNSSLLEATICGSSGQLRRREAILMVGGDRETFAACKPLLDLLAERTFYVGPSGHGSKIKLATNLVLGLNRLVLAEGLAFAECLGLDPGVFLEVLKAGPAYSAAMDVKGEKMLGSDFTAESRVRQHRKDVAIILKHANELKQELPLSRVHLDILEGAIAAGDGDLDTSAVIRQIKRMTKCSDGHRRKDQRL
jgi:3-hydroxyisobutyrate dehydrogenase-like beta-hydroxyacid dehydrogenase